MKDSYGHNSFMKKNKLSYFIIRIFISALDLLQVFSVFLRQWKKVSSSPAAGPVEQSMTLVFPGRV